MADATSKSDCTNIGTNAKLMALPHGVWTTDNSQGCLLQKMPIVIIHSIFFSYLYLRIITIKASRHEIPHRNTVV